MGVIPRKRLAGVLEVLRGASAFSGLNNTPNYAPWLEVGIVTARTDKGCLIGCMRGSRFPFSCPQCMIAIDGISLQH